MIVEILIPVGMAIFLGVVAYFLTRAIDRGERLEAS